MAQNVSWNGSNFSIPDVGNRQWGQNVTNYLVALAAGALSKAGGNFTLTADVNFGATYGLVSTYFKSRSSNISTTGVLRLANNEGVGFRNAANNADKLLKVNASDLLEYDGAALSTAANLAAHESDTSTHGVGQVLGASEAAVVTNKDIDGGTASNTNRLTVPKNATANLTALTRKQGTLLYDTSLGKLLVDDGTNLNAVGSGSGAGGVTLISNPSDAGSWSETGTVFATPVTTTTSGDLPLGGATSSAIQFVATGNGTEATNYNSYSVTTSAAMNGKLQVDFFLRPGTGFVASEWTVSVYQGSTRQTLDRDSSGVCYLPNTAGRFTVCFDAVASTAYTLRFARIAGSGSATLNVCNVFLGWPFVSSVAPVGKTQDVTVTGTWLTNTTYTSKETQFGQWAEYQVKVALTGAPTATALTVNLPSGRTIDTTALANSAGQLGSLLPFSTVGIFDNGTASYVGGVSYGTATSVNILWSDDAAVATQLFAVTATAPMTMANGDFITITFRVPIAEWAGSVSTGPAPAEEFVSGAITSDGNTTTTVYGPGGSRTPSVALGATRYAEVTFQYPKQTDDEYLLEIDYSGDGNFLPHNAHTAGSWAWQQQNSQDYGMYLTQVSPTVVRVNFARHSFPSGATFGAAGANWSAASSAKWRLRKTKKASLPYAKADSSASGLVAPRKGQTSLTVTSTAAGWATIRAQGVYYQDQDGNHRLKFNISGSITSAAVTGGTWTIAGVTFKNVTSHRQAINCMNNALAHAPLAYAEPGLSTVLVSHVSTTTQVYYMSGDVELDSKPTWA